MSLYQRLRATQMAHYFRKRDKRGRFICGRLHGLHETETDKEKFDRTVMEKAKWILEQAMKNLTKTH